MNRQAKAWMYSLVIVAIVFSVLVWLFPHAGNKVVYQGIFLNLPWVIPISFAIPIGIYAFTVFESNRKSLGVIYGLLALIVGVGGPFLTLHGANWRTAVAYTPVTADRVLEVDPDGVRFTPLETAHKKMKNKFNSSEFTVELEQVDAVEFDQPESMGGNGFRFVATIVPDGTVMTWTKKNPGVMIYDDRLTVRDDDRVRRTTQEFHIGEEMLWLDALYRNLYSKDRFCVYRDVYPLQLDPEDPDLVTLVAPKIKYRYERGFFRVPYWAGVTLVTSAGEITELSVEEALADQRLQGRHIFPRSLALEIVQDQRYDDGFFSGFIRREGKIEIPELPGENQMPYFTRMLGLENYYVVATTPDGGSDALFRLYFVNAQNGDFSVYQFDEDAGYIGPIKAMEVVKTLRGYVWVESDGSGSESGNHRVVESRYLSKNGRIYWLFSITTKDMSQIVANAVVDAKTEKPIEFETREAFDRWYRSDDLSLAEEVADDSGVEAELRAIHQELGLLTERVGTLLGRTQELSELD